MKNTKKILSVILAGMLAVSVLAGCGESEPESTTAATEADVTTEAAATEATEATEAAPEAAARDLGGREVIIGNWWSNSDDLNPTTTYEEELVAYREDIQATYNMTIKEKNICGWGEMQELCSTSIMAGSPEAEVFVLDSSFAAALLKQNLFYPVNELPSVDFNAKDKWNKLVADTMTFGGKTYGFSTSYEPRGGVFWNKRLFEEAGIDPDLPYDKQKDGTWTWDAFKEICAQTTRDIDNDGVYDTYALASFNKDFLTAAVFSNNARFVGKDASGNFVNATSDANFLEACQFVQQLAIDGYIMPQPDGSEWNWFGPAFLAGQAAMRVAEEYVKGDLKDMDDDFGFVMFPAGPNGSLSSAYRENILIVPSCFTAEEADDIMFAYDLWTDDVPGYEDDDSWKNALYSQYRDERAIDETLARMRTGLEGELQMQAYIAGLEVGDIAYNIWNLERTPAELIETASQTWNALISDANSAF